VVYARFGFVTPFAIHPGSTRIADTNCSLSVVSVVCCCYSQCARPALAQPVAPFVSGASTLLGVLWTRVCPAGLVETPLAQDPRQPAVASVSVYTHQALMACVFKCARLLQQQHTAFCQRLSARRVVFEVGVRSLFIKRVNSCSLFSVCMCRHRRVCQCQLLSCFQVQWYLL
jgi:hypothetical protein